MEPDPKEIEAFLAAYEKRRSRVFDLLRKWCPLILGLRQKRVSFDDIREVLQQRGVQVSSTWLRTFCRMELGEKPLRRKARKPGKVPRRKPAAADEPGSSSTAPRGRGPRIANLNLIEPSNESQH